MADWLAGQAIPDETLLRDEYYLLFFFLSLSFSSWNVMWKFTHLTDFNRLVVQLYFGECQMCFGTKKACHPKVCERSCVAIPVGGESLHVPAIRFMNTSHCKESQVWKKWLVIPTDCFLLLLLPTDRH